MKRIKLINTTIAASLAAISPLSLVLTSCGGDGININTNPNIKIECKEIVIGKELVIKYTLDSDFGFDLEKSTITFGDSNGVVSLLECEIDRDNKTITVPGKYVTSKKVKIDIKAENSKSTTVTEEQYYNALKNIIQYTNDRAFVINGPGTVKQYDSTGKEVESNNATLSFSANGFTDNLVEKIDSVEKPILQYWTEKDSIVGTWQYGQEYDGEEAIKVPSTGSFGSSFFNMMLIEMFPGYASMTYDTLFNAYYAKWTQEDTEWSGALKFDANHKLTSIIYSFNQTEKMTHSSTVGTFALGVDYSAHPTISIPTQSKVREEMLYDKDDEYKYVNNQLECSVHRNGEFGRFNIPLNKFTSFDKKKDLILKLDADVNVGGCKANVAINNIEISSDLYTFDDSKYILTIKSDAYSSLEASPKLNITTGNPGFGGSGSATPYTKFIICQY